MIRAVAAIAIAVYAPQFLSSTNLLYGALSSYANVIAGGLSGFVASGGSLKGAVLGAATAGMFDLAGDVGATFSEYGAAHYGAHALAGCASSALGGGDCGQGALSAVAGKAGTWASNGNMAITVVAGGVASVLGGGKFQNGAVTSAFGYLFNHCAHTDCFGSTKPIAPLGVSVDANIQDASSASFGIKGLRWFYDQVRNGGPWDYKQLGTEYENFGNFNFGATGAAFGFPEATLLRMAGWAQTRAGTSQFDWGVAPSKVEAYMGIGGRAPFGDDPNDQAWIKRGIDYYQRTRRKP